MKVESVCLRNYDRFYIILRILPTEIVNARVTTKILLEILWSKGEKRFFGSFFMLSKSYF